MSRDEEPIDGDHGQTLWFYNATYSFLDSKGQSVLGHLSGEGRIRHDPTNKSEKLFVEYLPRYPEINRLRLNDKPQDWIQILARLLIMIIFWIGFISVWTAFLLKRISISKSKAN